MQLRGTVWSRCSGQVSFRLGVTMRLLFLGAMLLAGAAAAQPMYRCGSTISDKPCAADAQAYRPAGSPPPLAAVPDAPVAPDIEQAARDVCLAAIRMRLKDPDSMKADTVRRGALSTRKVGDRNLRARGYVAFVNAKNGFGGYTGEKVWTCFMDPADERKLLDVLQPLS